jgi:hypothetical protein
VAAVCPTPCRLPSRQLTHVWFQFYLDSVFPCKVNELGRVTPWDWSASGRTLNVQESVQAKCPTLQNPEALGTRQFNLSKPAQKTCHPPADGLCVPAVPEKGS